MQKRSDVVAGHEVTGRDLAQGGADFGADAAADAAVADDIALGRIFAENGDGQLLVHQFHQALNGDGEVSMME